MTQRGFSIVELMVCCSIILILSGMVYPAFDRMRQSRLLHNEIRLLYSNLQYAKAEAIKLNSYVVFKITKTGYLIFVDDGGGGGQKGDWKVQQSEKQLANHTYRDGVFLAKTTFKKQRTRFNGRVCMKAGRVILQNQDGLKTELVVSTVGRLRIGKL